MKEFKDSWEIKGSPADVYRALTDPEIVEEWSGAPATMGPNEGDEFNLFGGDIHGVNRSMTANEEIVQDWYGGNDWATPSKVTLSLNEEREFTLIDLDHQGIPDEEFDNVRKVWDEFFFPRLQGFFEEKLKSDFIDEEDMGHRFQDPTVRE